MTLTRRIRTKKKILFSNVFCCYPNNIKSDRSKTPKEQTQKGSAIQDLYGLLIYSCQINTKHVRDRQRREQPEPALQRIHHFVVSPQEVSKCSPPSCRVGNELEEPFENSHWTQSVCDPEVTDSVGVATTQRYLSVKHIFLIFTPTLFLYLVGRVFHQAFGGKKSQNCK